MKEEDLKEEDLGSSKAKNYTDDVKEELPLLSTEEENQKL